MNRLVNTALKYAHFSSECVARPWLRGQPVLSSVFAGFLAYAVALFVTFPGTLLHRNFFHTRMWDTLSLTQDLFARGLQEQIMAYRLTVPALAKFLHIGHPALLTILFQILPSVATLALLYFNAARRVGPRTAWPITLALALSFLLFYTFYYGGLFDPFTHLCLALVMTSKNPLVCGICTLAGFFNDERFAISVPFALLWHAQDGSLATLFRQLLRPTIGVLVGIAIALALRHGLHTGWVGPGIEVTQRYRLSWHEAVTTLRPFDTKSFTAGWAVFALNFFMSFRWTWLLVAQFFLKRSPRFSPLFRALFLAALIPPVLSSVAVMDVAKSIGYLFPAIFFCVVNLVADCKDSPTFPNRLWLTVAALVITPVCCINGVYPAFWLPLPVEGVRSLIEGIWGIDIIREWIVPAVHSDTILIPADSWKK